MFAPYLPRNSTFTLRYILIPKVYIIFSKVYHPSGSFVILECGYTFQILTTVICFVCLHEYCVLWHPTYLTHFVLQTLYWELCILHIGPKNLFLSLLFFLHHSHNPGVVNPKWEQGRKVQRTNQNMCCIYSWFIAGVSESACQSILTFLMEHFWKIKTLELQ